MALGRRSAKKIAAPPVREINGADRAALLYGAPKPVVAPVYGAGKATDFVNRAKKVYP
jgi:hypothetical protein